MLVLLLTFCKSYAQKQKVWLDADTGNETDDVYAIVQLLNSSSVDLIGLSSAHFNNADLTAFKKWNQYDTKGINTVNISQKLNEEILGLSGKKNVIHPLGADRQMGRAWGGSDPRNSAAAQEIIKAVKALPPTEQLHIICLGALTNIASAIALDTTISSHLKCYLLGAGYNAEKKYWNKSEFNIRNDLNAFDYLLNNPSVNLTIMPITTAAPYRFERDSLYALFTSKNVVLQYLKQRWQETNPDDKVRTLWDLALVQAYLEPAEAIKQTVLTPPENTQRYINVYTNIDIKKMKAVFYQTINKLRASK